MSEPLVLEHDPESGCGDCLFHHYRGGDRCLIVDPGGDGGRRIHGDDIDACAPLWCPLRTSPVLIRTPESRDE